MPSATTKRLASVDQGRRAPGALPQRIPARSACPEPVRPMAPRNDADLLHEVLDGPRRLDGGMAR